MAFKVGDRVRISWVPKSPNPWHGKTGTIVELTDLDHLVAIDHPEKGCDRGYFSERNLEPVEPLKLEVGATVTIGDGKDEWEVTYLDSYGQAKCTRGPSFAWAAIKGLTVVKAKPEPPEPDYYVNCKGAEPEDGDVFTDSINQTCHVKAGIYSVVGFHDTFRLNGPCVNAIGGSARRFLVARANKPYTGNV